MVAPEGFVYVGTFVNGKPEGEGKLIFPSGEEHTVLWKDDQMTVDGQVIPFKPAEQKNVPHDSIETLTDTFALQRFGSFWHSQEIPYALFLFDPIKSGDAFQFKKALRRNKISTLVLSSPGGLVSEALLIADSAHDLGLSTYVPREALSEEGNCASACAFILFSGLEREIDGKLGVHQFYSEKAGVTRDIGSEENTQFNVSEIIGFLNKYETPPWVYERMFERKEMYYFTTDEKRLLEISFAGERQRKLQDIKSFMVRLNQELSSE